MAAKSKLKQKYIPGSDVESEEIFKYPVTMDDDTIDFLQGHGRIMFIVRGLPGTGKNSLVKMLVQRYPTSVLCSADSYFSNTFSSFKRDKDTLARSHDFCHKKVNNACLKDNHPIIVQNTHVKKKELQEYLNYAAEYNYTVIMVSTMNKFKVSPEILAQSNTKGLNADYFRSRLKQWEEIIPVLTGWFLSPGDSSYLMRELEKGLDILLGDGKFCRILNVFKKADLLRHYKVRKLIYCIAACGENNSCDEIKSYYLSANVAEHYGQCFTIVIRGFIVTPSTVSAIVGLDETMKNLRYIKTCTSHSENSDMDSLVSTFYSFGLGNNFLNHFRTVNFEDNFESSGSKSTRRLEQDKHTKNINVKYCSFMHLAESNTKPSKPMKMMDFCFKTLSQAADKNGIICPDQFAVLEDDYKVCRLPMNAWLIEPPYTLSFETVFTGLYV